MTRVHTKFHMPSSNSSSVIADKPEAKYRFPVVSMSKIHYPVHFNYPTVNGASVASVAIACTAAMLALLTVQDYKGIKVT